MQSDQPKQYMALAGRAVLQHVLAAFEANARIASIHVLISAQDTHWQPAWLQACHKTRVLSCGGQSRAETVLNGLHALHGIAKDEDWILVHDAARPGLTQSMLNRLIDSVLQHQQGGILAIPLADTLKRQTADQTIRETVPRAGLWQAQTPQMFHYRALTEALSTHLSRQPTDEAQVMEWSGVQPQLVLGGLRNMKITYPQDVRLLEALMTLDIEDEIV